MTPAASQAKTRKKNVSSRCSERLVVDNLPLVRYILRGPATHLPPSVDHEDLVEAGFIGLIDASRKFDPDRGVKFRTCAIARIRGSMLDELRTQDWPPFLNARDRSAARRGADDAANASETNEGHIDY